MTKILYIDRFGELNYQDVTTAYLSNYQDTTRLVIGTMGWDMPREDAENWIMKLANGKQDDLIDLRELGRAQ